MLHSVLFCITAALIVAVAAPVVAGAQAQPVKVTYTVPAELSDQEKKWYEIFQKGNALAVGWVSISQDLLSRLPLSEQLEQKERLRELGDKIGREWCKDNRTRKIDTTMLRQWGKELKIASGKGNEVLTLALNSIDQKVERQLAK